MNYTETADIADEIAIIGMAGRFPGARNIDEFWQNLRDGVESISFFSEQEVEFNGIDAGLSKDPRLVKAAGVLAGVELFDASFFGFSPREAEITDPQQRLFLECAWEALESAGYDSEKHEGLIGVYAGVSMNTYMMNLYSNRELFRTVGPLQIGICNDKDFLCTRLSYKLNLRGPSFTIQTACSTSLVAVHLACQSLLDGQCDMAISGGVSVTLPQKTGYFYQEGGIHSPDGHCRAFDSKADGFVKGNGVGVVILKRLEDAFHDRDTIYAVIRGSAINNDGSVKAGYTAPSELGQAEVIASALAMAGVAPETISYIETHGTATALGDPIEIAALTNALRSNSKNGLCAIGSVKTNIGHLDAAAGVASLIKTVLALKHKSIPPSLNFEQPNPRIDLAGSGFFVNDRLTEWKAKAHPRRAGVSSFGIGGTNAHVVLEEAPAVESVSSSWPFHLLVLSAKTETALESATLNLAKYLAQHEEVNLADVAHTLQVGRREFDYRRAIACCNVAEAVDALETLNPGRVITAARESSDQPVVFMFSGQGTQYVNMGLELYRVEPVFREQVDLCSEVVRPCLGCDLRSVIYPREEQIAAASEQLKQTYITQPALFTIEYALAKMWMSWGVFPRALIGHSIGEFVAACLAGVFTLEEALHLVAARGRLMQQMSPGSMLTAPLPEDELRELMVGTGLSVAAVNGPSNCVVSGATEAVEKFECELSKKAIACRRLETSHAFHSAMMEPVVESFIKEVSRVTLKTPELPYISNVTGHWIKEEAREPSYWGQHLRETVRFSEGAAELLRKARAFLEIGPGQALSTLIRKQAGYSDKTVVVTSLRHAQEIDSDVAHWQKSMGRLWASGVSVNWKTLYPGEKRGRIALPSYPFEPERYWIEFGQEMYSSEEAPASREKKPNLAEWFYVPIWRESLSAPIQDDERLGHRTWLVFADDCGFGPQMVEMLKHKQQDVLTVNAGSSFQRLSESLYTIRPANRDDYCDLLRELRAAGKLPDVIFHLWNITPASGARKRIDQLTDSQASSFYSLLFLAQALGEESLSNEIEADAPSRAHQIFVVSNGMQDITGEDLWSPEKALLLGPCRVIPQEYPHIACHSIDLTIPAHDTQQSKQLIERLISEVIAEPSAAVIAYRGSHRWTQTFTALALQGKKESPKRLRERGVYLITGGLGGIGLEIAEYLARTVRAKLVLIGRTVLPEMEEWDAWLRTHAVDDQVSGKIRRAKRLLGAGAEVLFASADVTSSEEVQQVLERAHRRFGEIHGVIHAAGVPGEGLMQLKTAEAAAKVLAPKVAGTFILGDLLKDTAMDFFVLCSSIRSIQGGAGHSDYCAANAFLDAFARYKNSTDGTPAQSINWGGWSDVGMSVDYLLRHDLDPDDALKGGMSSAEGVEAFCRALETTLPQIIVAPQDLQMLLEESKPRFHSAGAPEPAQRASSRAGHQRPRLKDAFVAPRTETEQFIAKLWQDLLGVETVGIHDNFFELGGDSILSLRIIARANHAGLRLATNDIFKHQTISELAAVVGASDVVQAEQGILTGNVPLTPIQHWFFEQEFADQHHWNQAVLLELRDGGQPTLIEQIVEQLLGHHDALRLRFHRSDEGWVQHYEQLEEKLPIRWVDLSGMSETERVQAIELESAKAQTSLRLSEGPMLRVVGFCLEERKASRLLIVIHHLVTDVVSWRILLEDFATAYGQLRRGEAVRLPAKTTSYKQWSKRLTELAQSAAMKEDLKYWLKQLHKAAPRLPVDFDNGDNTVGSARAAFASLSVEETTALLQEVPAVYQTQITDVLLTALAQAVAKWTGERTVLMDVEGHGREAFSNDLDLSRTVGWFTAVFPVLIEFDETGVEGTLKSIKEQLRRIPRHGLSYGILRYLSEDGIRADQLRALQQPEIGFLYLGQFDQELSESAPFELAGESSGASQSPRQRRSHVLDFDGRVANGQFQLTLTYSENLHHSETIKELAEGFIEEVRALIRNCQTAQATDYIASDFPDAELSQQELDDLITSLTVAEH